LIDSLGALLSALILGLVLTRWESVFGMPKRVLYFLAAIAAVFLYRDYPGGRPVNNRTEKSIVEPC
jgi:hypothetical protein